MADTSVPITAGIGTPIATDDVGGKHHQVVKLAYGPFGARTLVDMPAGLPVQPATGIGATPFPVQHQLNATDLSEIAINIAANGDNSIVAGTALQIIRVWAFFLKINGAAGVSLKFRSAANDLHPALPFLDKDGWMMAFQTRPWFTCTVAEALQINLSAAIQVSGRLYYTKA